MSDTEAKEEKVEVTDLTSDVVVSRYLSAAEIANKTLNGLLTFCKVGTKVVSACGFGDTLIDKQCEGVSKSKTMERGIAFPTCISLNNVVCHNSPLDGDDEVIKAGDVVKIDFGVQVDGYVVVVAHTFVAKGDNAEEKSEEYKEKLNNTMVAAHTALEACFKLMKPGVKNSVLTDAVQKVAECYGVTPVQGVLMHQHKRFIIDGNEVVIQKDDKEHKVDTFEFSENQVYTIDIVMSSGEGKPAERDRRTTVFKRAIDQNYSLKMKASRSVFNVINNDLSMYPFSLRKIAQKTDDKIAKMGIVECMKHNMLHSYPILFEKPDEAVVHLKTTLTVRPNATAKLTGINKSLEDIKKEFPSKKEATEEITNWLKMSSKTKKKKQAETN